MQNKKMVYCLSNVEDWSWLLRSVKFDFLQIYFSLLLVLWRSFPKTIRSIKFLNTRVGKVKRLVKLSSKFSQTIHLSYLWIMLVIIFTFSWVLRKCFVTLSLCLCFSLCLFSFQGISLFATRNSKYKIIVIISYIKSFLQNYDDGLPKKIVFIKAFSNKSFFL